MDFMKRRELINVLLTTVVAAVVITIAGAGGYWPLSSVGISAAPPEDKAAAETVRFVALGDTGTGGEEQLAVARRMVSYHDEKHYDTVLLLGDNVYPTGNPSELPAKFEKPYAELLKRGVRFYAVLGNHDVNHGNGAGQINYKPFNMGGRYYSFVKGDGLVEFFALDSNRMDREQLSWLEGALAASKARWKIALFHHPIYSSSKAHGSNIRLRALLEPLLVRYGVAAAFSGHDHVYERIKLQQGVQYFVAGAGGKLRRGNINRTSPLLAVGNDEFHSFMYVEVKRDRLTYWVVEPEGRILDVGYLAPPKQASARQ
jgi:predicted MPP superfamily phosphohydrolase